MALNDSTIQGLPAVVTPAGTDLFPVDQANTTKKETLTQVSTYTTETHTVPDAGGFFTSDTVVAALQALSVGTLGVAPVVHNQNNLSTGDFQIKGQTNNNLFYTDVSADAIGVGIDTPLSLLHVKAPSGSGVFSIDSADVTKDRWTMSSGDFSGNAVLQIADQDDVGIALTIEGNTGNTGIGILSPQGKLDVSSGNAGTSPAIMFGADFGAETRTNLTRKVGVMSIPHYTNAEEPFSLLVADSDTTINDLRIGGGVAVNNASTQLSFYTAADTTTLSGTRRMVVDSIGNVGIANSTSPGGKLHVSSGNIGTSPTILFGADINDITCTNLTRKFATLSTPHYTNAEEPFSILSADANTSENILMIGGGLANNNTATHIRFYTAANTTTLSGTQKMEILPNGNIGIGISPSYKLDVCAATRTVNICATSGTGLYSETAGNIGICGVAVNQGVYGSASTAQGVRGDAPTIAVFGVATGNIGICGEAVSQAGKFTASAGIAVLGIGTSAGGIFCASNFGACGIATSGHTGVFGCAFTSCGVRGFANNERGGCFCALGDYGVVGQTSNNVGVWGVAAVCYGVIGRATTSYGVWGCAIGGTGISVGGNTGYNTASNKYQKISKKNISVLNCLRNNPIEIHQWLWEDTNNTGFSQFIGPYAQDIKDVFDLTFEDTNMFTVDGIAFAGVNELLTELDILKNRVKQLELKEAV